MAEGFILDNSKLLARVNELLAYDGATGVFTWKVARRGKARVGSVAGNVRSDGYVCLRIDGTAFKAHRLAFLITYGYLPAYVDHVDRNPTNNRIANLREATKQENCFNQCKHINNTSGYKGVDWHNNKHRARARLKGKDVHIGYFPTPEAASEAYIRFCELHHGEFFFSDSSTTQNLLQV